MFAVPSVSDILDAFAAKVAAATPHPKAKNPKGVCGSNNRAAAGAAIERDRTD